MVASHMVLTGDPACNPGMCPDWESNRWPFGLQPMLSPLSYTSQGHKDEIQIKMLNLKSTMHTEEVVVITYYVTALYFLIK